MFLELGGPRLTKFSEVLYYSYTDSVRMLLLGGLGACPPGKIWKIDALRLHLRAFLSTSAHDVLK